MSAGFIPEQLTTTPEQQITSCVITWSIFPTVLELPSSICGIQDSNNIGLQISFFYLITQWNGP